MAEADCDVIIIGGGHNGLVAAAYLARAGRKVVLIERRDELGGASGSTRAPAGQPLAVGAQDVSLFQPLILRDLQLNLRLLRPDISLLSLLPDGRPLRLWRDPVQAAASIAERSQHDAASYQRFAAQVEMQAGLLRQMLHRRPPNLPADGRLSTIRAALPWLGVALRLRRMGPRSMFEFVRTLPMDAARLLEEWFELTELRGALGAGGVVGLMQGPRSSGTALMLLYQAVGGFPRGAQFVRGGIGSLIAELERAATRFGVEICKGAAVERILSDDYAAVGVQLADGSELRARSVASSADPRHTLFDLVGAPQLELRVVQRIGNIRYRGSTSRVNLVVRGLPQFSGVENPEHLMGHVVLAPSLDYLERAYDDAKYGRISAEPHLSFTIPTLHAESPDPADTQVLSVTVRYTPFQLRSGGWDGRGAALGDQVVELLARHAPDLEQRILHRQVLTPADLAEQYGLPEGSIHHGQMALDQLLFMRPIPGFAGYRSPVDRLYFCGAGAHPGGGITGMPGRNAARVILKDLRGGRRLRR